MADRKAVIKNADMSEDMQQDAIDCATQALEKYNIEKDIAAFIKKEFDKKYNPTWHCIVGRNFGSYVTHETKHFIYFYLGQVAILLFKSGCARFGVSDLPFFSLPPLPAAMHPQPPNPTPPCGGPWRRKVLAEGSRCAATASRRTFSHVFDSRFESPDLAEKGSITIQLGRSSSSFVIQSAPLRPSVRGVRVREPSSASLCHRAYGTSLWSFVTGQSSESTNRSAGPSQKKRSPV